MGPLEFSLFYIDLGRKRYGSDTSSQLTGLGMQAPKGMRVIETHVRHPHNRMGHLYQMHPELTRPGLPVFLSPAAIPAAVVLGSIVGAEITTDAYESMVIDRAPEHEKRSFWQVFSSGLTGTVGIGSGLNL